VAAALIGSIGLGGGLAYVYKSVVAPRNGERTQVVKAPREPARVAPAERGGKQLPSTTNNSVMSRVPPEGTSAAPGGITDSTGVRRVPTVAVDRNLAPLPPAPPTTSAGVPGMIVVGGNNSGLSSPMPSFEPPPRAAAPPPAPPPAQARVAAAPPPPAVRPPPRAPTPEPPQPSERQAAAVPRAKPAGYVAVLGYQRSQLEAMKMMADLQQKYDALRDKKLQIVQSDQTARGLGVIYRVVVGPPGSITPAKDVCQQLYKAGMRQSGCYPLASN
jgi:hypothetical protein